LNFDEQWRRAVAVNPKFVFVTGWNEWIAGRYTQRSKYEDSDCYYPSGLLVDEYTQEYSLDCEPMRGGHRDNYYYQLAAWVRRFKGVRERLKAPGPSRIVIDGSFEDWRKVQPEFRDTIGDTIHRDHKGYGDLVYRDDTGRNDFAIAKAAYDKANLYFFVQTLDKITPRTGRNWMLLLLDTDQDANSGWLGYDFIVDLEVLNDKETTVKAWHAGQWQTVGRARYRANGNGMELAVPRSLVRQGKQTPAFDFHWADNLQNFGDASDLDLAGDSAPDGRWNYRFKVEPK
jgi:hypothetical protein